MSESVIVAGARTPIGKFLGAFSSLSAVDLGGAAIAEALQRSAVDPASVDYVIMGHVLQAGQGQITARQAAVKGGLGMDIPAITVNKVCLSGLNGDGNRVENDEGIRPGMTAESIAKMRPAFTKEGTITAANASQISDGAAALVVTSRERAERDGLPILATIVAHGMVAGPDPS